MVVQTVLHQFDYVARHIGIDLFCQTYEARFKAMQSRLPRQIMRVQWNAMSSDSGSRIEGHEAERFGRCRLNHFPGVYVQVITELGDFVHQSDVDGAVGVL